MFSQKISRKYVELNKQLSKILIDPVTREVITDPVITKEGETYSGRAILNLQLHASDTSPSHEPLNEDDLLPNITLVNIVDTLETSKNFYHLQVQLRLHLQCPLSKALFEEPVVAADGYTYEKTYIENYLEEHGAPPKELFWNHDSHALIENVLIQNIIALLSKHNLNYDRDQIGENLNKHQIALLDYAAQLSKLNPPINLVGSNYAKGEKILAAIKLVSALTEPMPFSAIDERTLDILLNSDLQRIAIPALGFLLATEHFLPDYLESENKKSAEKVPTERPRTSFGRQ
jgi:hypothetical protein